MADDLTTTRVAVCGPMSQGVEYHVHDAGCVEFWTLRVAVLRSVARAGSAR